MTKLPNKEFRQMVPTIREEGFYEYEETKSISGPEYNLSQIEDAKEEMTDEHWKIVNYLRDYYMKFDIAPMIRKLCKETGFPLKKIYELFPSGPAKGACKVAGLAKPTGCV